MKTIKRYCRLYRILISQFFKTIMQSKVDFMIGLIGFFMTQAAGIAFLYLIFEQIPDLNGWSFDHLLFIYGFAQIPRGIDHLFTDNIWLVAYWMVIDGDFDRYLLRPMNLFFQIISEKLQPDALGELLVGIILICISASKDILTIDVVHILLFLVSVIAGAFIYTSIKLFFATIAFWIKQSGPFLQVAYNMANFAKYPTEVYGKAVRFVITWVIPFSFVAYLPAAYFIGKQSAASTIGIECIIAVIFSVIAYRFFIYGSKCYESAGN